MKNSLAIPQIVEHRTTVWNSALICIPKELKIETETNICALMFIEALFTIAKIFNPNIHLQINGFLNYIYI